MRKAVIISGFLNDLSDNIIPFLNIDTDVYVHTWDTDENKKWIIKLNRYKKYCNNLYITIDKPIERYCKLYSYFTSTYRAVKMISNLLEYQKIIKFKPNIEGKIPYEGDIQSYFTKAKVQCRPILDDIDIDSCVFGCSYYYTLDERIFTATPKAIGKMFSYDSKEFENRMISSYSRIKADYGNNPEGSIFWRDWFDLHHLYIIQDNDLKLNNNIQNGQTRKY